MHITDVEQLIVGALKNKETVKASTLRLLLARLKNERIAAGHDFSDQEVEAIVQSEYKKRKEAAAEFEKAGRAELVAGERAEADILLSLLPPQASEADIVAAVDELIREKAYVKKDFGLAMKDLKEKFGATADGAELSRVLKERLA